MVTTLAAVPHANQTKAAQALAEAFPGSKPESVAPLHGGLSGALVYKVVVDGQQVVLRIIDGLNPFKNPIRQFTCMQLAAEQGVAPRVYYANAELGVSITAFVQPQPVMGLLRSDIHHVAAFGDLLRRLHGGPAFPVYPDVFQMIQDGWERLTQADVVLPALIHELLAAFQTVKQAVQAHLTSAPCHNDLNPGNVLYDGARLWLVDWEGASMGEPMFDLAGLCLWFVLDTQQEATLLKAYFQRMPTEREVAKLALMKHVSWTLHAIIFLLFSLEGEGPHAMVPVAREHLPSFPEALRAIGAGEQRLQDAADRQRLGQVMAKQSLDEMRRREFSQALNCLTAA